jgi:hypothetical protein
LLWSGGQAKHAQAAHRLLLGSIWHYCVACGIEVSPRELFAQSSVFFRSRDGASLRASISLKYARHVRRDRRLADRGKQVDFFALVLVELSEKDSERTQALKTTLERLPPAERPRLLVIDAQRRLVSEGAEHSPEESLTESAYVAPPRSGHYALRSLLLSLFSGAEQKLRSFVASIPYREDLSASLPGQVASLDELCTEAASLLIRRNLAGTALDRLADEYPEQVDKVDSVIDRLG